MDWDALSSVWLCLSQWIKAKWWTWDWLEAEGQTIVVENIEIRLNKPWWWWWCVLWRLLWDYGLWRLWRLCGVGSSPSKDFLYGIAWCLQESSCKAGDCIIWNHHRDPHFQLQGKMVSWSQTLWLATSTHFFPSFSRNQDVHEAAGLSWYRGKQGFPPASCCIPADFSSPLRGKLQGSVYTGEDALHWSTRLNMMASPTSEVWKICGHWLLSASTQICCLGLWESPGPDGHSRESLMVKPSNILYKEKIYLLNVSLNLKGQVRSTEATMQKQCKEVGKGALIGLL